MIMHEIPSEDDLLPFGSFDEGDEGDRVHQLGVGESGVKVSLVGPLLDVKPAEEDRVDVEVGEAHDASRFERLRIRCTALRVTPSLHPICSAET